MSSQPTSTTPWLWDAAKQAYYLLSEDQQSREYQDGTRTGDFSPPQRLRDPRYDATSAATATFEQSRNNPYPNTGTDSGIGSYNLADQFSSLGIGSTSTYPVQSSYAGVQQYPGGNSHQTWGRKISGTHGDSERLDRNYRKRGEGRSFFRVGKVIKILWPEPPGGNTEGMTIVSDSKFEGEKFVSKIRWFVVVKEGMQSCTCVPISTYQGQACGKPGVAKWQHCVVYTSEEPGILSSEAPGIGELPMLTAIRVKQRDRRDKMYSTSRINFGKVYTVEHNVKVYEFGDVHKNFMVQFKAQWDYVNQCDYTGPGIGNNTIGLGLGPVEEKSEIIPELDPDPPKFPIHGTATSPWNDTTMEAQLSFETGDRIFVREFRDQNWAMGRNENTQQEGQFPRACIQLDPADWATAAWDLKADKKSKSQLTFRAGDRIIVTDYHDIGWDKGENMTTGEKGIFPYNYVRRDRGSFATALFNYIDDTKPNALNFKKRDRILVLETIDIHWARGRNEQTRQEGIFPSSYVTYDA